MWYEETTFYQIYPLGMCGAPLENDGIVTSRINRIPDWIPYYQKLGIGAILFNPLLESDRHGYDTRDFLKLDARLGTNQDFKAVCGALHEAGIRVVLDGVFNHVGRGFWAFRDVCEKKWDSPYKDWFYLSFDGNSNYDDGFWYEGWEGHFDLVKLNLRNPEVIEHLLSSVDFWLTEFGIDGIRLDVAYSLDHDFMCRLRERTSSQKEDFFLVGEMLHGDYKTIVNPSMLHSATNYECYKGLYSSLNSRNFFEIAHSLNRQFGSEDWTLYKGISLLNFVDNHDVTRAASILTTAEHLPLLYTMLFCMPGIPCLYYGSEWGIQGEKIPGQSDDSLRPALTSPVTTPLSDLIERLCHIRSEYKALFYGDYQVLYLTNQQFIFHRFYDGQRLLAVFNADGSEHTATISRAEVPALSLLDQSEVTLSGELVLPGYSSAVYLIEDDLSHHPL
ncbi:MAG: alpha-amylase family glycosyl hydrolase [Lachnospiraceae bacterium]